MFIPLNAFAFIEFFAIQAQRLFEGGVYFKITFSKIIDINYDKSFLNIKQNRQMFNISISRVFFPGDNRYCLVDVHYKVVPSLSYNPRLNAAFVLFGAAYIFNFASICGVKSRVAFIRVITVYESTTSFSELFLISISTDIFFLW